jgi:O-antigen/teichoic acid export membrane protein
LGLRAFGIWALTGALAQYATLLDFGVGQTLVRFVALHVAQSRRAVTGIVGSHSEEAGSNAIGEFIAVGYASVAVVCAVLLALSFALGPPLAHQFRGIGSRSMTALLLCSTTIVATSMLNRVLIAYSIGRRAMVAPNVAQSLTAVLYFICSIGVILLGGKLVAYAIANAAAGVLGVVVTMTVVLRQTPKPPLCWPSRRRAKELVTFSVKNQALAISSLVNYQSDKVVLALFIGPAVAGAYELSNRVALAARAVGVYTVSAMVPTLTAWRASGTRDQLVAAYERLTAISSALAVPCLALSAAVAPLLLRAWLGHAPRNGAVILAALSIAYVANTTTGVGYATAYAEGLPGIPARAAIATALANVALTVGLTPVFGLWGTLTGTVVALTVGALYQVKLLHGRLSVPMAAYWRATLSTLVLSTVLTGPIIVCDVAGASATRWLASLLCVASGVYYGVAYAVIAGRRGALPEAIMRRLPRFATASA